MSQMNQDDDQNYILGVVGAIIFAVLIGVVSLSINATDSINSNQSNQSSENTTAAGSGDNKPLSDSNTNLEEAKNRPIEFSKQ
jgi:hypothetical protein